MTDTPGLVEHLTTKIKEESPDVKMIAAPTALMTASGRLVDLVGPRPEDVDFADIAEHLAKENRYNGATRDVAYSVAQHLVAGAGHLRAATGDDRAAAYFVLHDAPEAYLKDDTTPKKRAIEAVAADFGVIAGTIIKAFGALTERWDVAIHAAAGLPWPPPPEIAELVHRYDRIMLATEWCSFMPGDPPFDTTGAEPLPIRIVPWPSWTRARYELRNTFRQLLPALKGEQGFFELPQGWLCGDQP